MTIDDERRVPVLPDRWGEGLIFAFSGMDGLTHTASQFVATAAAEPYGLLIHTPRRRFLRVVCDTITSVRVATGDVLVAQAASQAPLVLAYAAWHTLVGQLPVDGSVSLAFEEGEAAEEAEASDGTRVQVTADADHKDAVALAQRGYRFAVAYGATVDEAGERAVAALGADLDAVVAARLAVYQDLLALEWRGHERLFAKCVSVMRANTLAPECVFRQHWSTPDRVPHRHMWLWDSVFHSFGMNLIDPRLAWEFLAAVLDRQVGAQDGDDGPPGALNQIGMISHCMHVDGVTSRITQPPILAWGVWENYQAHGATQADLVYALPRLEAYLAWNLAHRDVNDNGLLAWYIEGDPLCRSGESGMDNSPRFDRAALLDAVDFSTFQALDMAMTARIAAALGDAEKARLWQARSSEMARRIHTGLWNPDQGFYCDRDMDGQLSPVKAVSGFLPLLLDTIPREHVDALVAHLHNPETFDSAFPVPSVSLDDAAWSTDMWRGATWINYDYLIVLGLRKQGRAVEAERIAARWIAYVTRYYDEYGVLFEFYDAKDARLPVACDRKGKRREPYDIRRKMDSIRDYHWTAALTAHLLSGLDSTLLDP